MLIEVLEVHEKAWMFGVITLADCWEGLMKAFVEMGAMEPRSLTLTIKILWTSSPISPEEVRWALDKDAAPGQDGVVAEMMMADCLFEV